MDVFMGTSQQNGAFHGKIPAKWMFSWKKNSPKKWRVPPQVYRGCPEITALYAVFMAPRDDATTITWRKAHGGAEEQGCHVVRAPQGTLVGTVEMTTTSSCGIHYFL